jgi:hypothetical protein
MGIHPVILTRVLCLYIKELTRYPNQHDYPIANCLQRGGFLCGIQVGNKPRSYARNGRFGQAWCEWDHLSTKREAKALLLGVFWR